MELQLMLNESETIQELVSPYCSSSKFHGLDTQVQEEYSCQTCQSSFCERHQHENSPQQGSSSYGQTPRALFSGFMMGSVDTKIDGRDKKLCLLHTLECGHGDSSSVFSTEVPTSPLDDSYENGGEKASYNEKKRLVGEFLDNTSAGLT